MILDMGFAPSSSLQKNQFVDSAYQERIENDYSGLVRKVKRMLDDDGLAMLEDFIAPGFLAELQASITELIAKCYEGEKRRPLVGSDLEGTIFWEVTFSEFLMRFVNDLLADFRVNLEPGDVHPVLNILTGDKGQDAVEDWHFDATYLTIAMPIIMPLPTAQGDGKFRIWPNVRSFSQNGTLNKIYWNLAKIDLLRRMTRNVAINLVPGNLYFFYGFRCYHGVDKLDASELRANCLMNFGGPLFDLDRGKKIRYRG
jgi:hypothetical protein